MGQQLDCPTGIGRIIKAPIPSYFLTTFLDLAQESFDKDISHPRPRELVQTIVHARHGGPQILKDGKFVVLWHIHLALPFEGS
jgi:hypothetical protein